MGLAMVRWAKLRRLSKLDEFRFCIPVAQGSPTALGQQRSLNGVPHEVRLGPEADGLPCAKEHVSGLGPKPLARIFRAARKQHHRTITRPLETAILTAYLDVRPT